MVVIMIFIIIINLPIIMILEVSEQACEWKGSQVCEGAVTLETKSLLQVDKEDDADDNDGGDDDNDNGAEVTDNDDEKDQVDDLVKPPTDHGSGVALADDDDGDDQGDDDDYPGVRGRQAEVPQTREGGARLSKGRSR